LDAKAVVREHYGRIATGGTGCCGGTSAEQVAREIGYGNQELEAVPDGANLGLGCGNPTAIAALQPGETVVDLGSGAGLDCFLAARQVGAAGCVIGIDMTDEMLERARENAARGGFSNVEFRKGDIEALPVEDASVDVLLSNCVLNLVPDKRRAFDEITRVLKPGGRIAVSDIVLERPLPRELAEDATAYAGCVSGAILRGDYLRLLKEVGLTDLQVTAETDAGALVQASPAVGANGSGCACAATVPAGLVSSIHVSARRPEKGSP
jgi:arsenite methyltransferase